MVLSLRTTLLGGQGNQKHREILLYTATAAVVVVGTMRLNTLRKTYSSKKNTPPRVSSWPVLGSALEFGADCRAFLKKYFTKLRTPIFTANIAGKDFHFVDTSYAGFSPERLFRSSQLTFRPISNDAALYGFALDADLVQRVNGPDGNAKDVNSIYHTHMLTPDGLTELLTKAQTRLEKLVFCDAELYPSASAPNKNTSTKPLYWLIRQSLFRATIGAVISESIVAGSETASKSLQEFADHDDKFPLLLAKLPSWMFPAAMKGLYALRQKSQGPDFYKGLSNMLKERNELFQTSQFNIHTERDIGELSAVLIWAAAANTMPTGFWLIYNLLKHKETAYVAIQKEVTALYSKRQKPGPLSIAELDQLTGLDSALTETLRIYSESMIARDVMEDFELDLKITTSSGGSDHKYFLKKNSRVAVMMSCLHMDESVFSNASNFRWDRFLPDPTTGNKPPVFTKNGKTLANPVRAFGGGISMCPGRKFASYEIKAFVAELICRYDLELVDPTLNLKIDRSRPPVGIRVPLEDAHVKITRRN